MGALLLIAVGCSHSSHAHKKDAGSEMVRQTLMIKPGGSAEECIELTPGKVFDYEFEATDFVNFNIHYHAMDEVKYPVSKKGVMFSSGNIDPRNEDYYTPDQDYYCLMWDNLNAEKVKVSFTCVIKQPPAK